MHPTPLVTQVSEISPPRYCLQGLESEESSEEEELCFSREHFSSFTEGRMSMQLNIAFKNPFQRQKLIRQELSVDGQAAEPRQRHPGQPDGQPARSCGPQVSMRAVRPA